MSKERNLDDAELKNVSGGGLTPGGTGQEHTDEHKGGVGGTVNEVEGQDPPSNTPTVPGQSS